MPKFSYQALDSKGRHIKSEITADTLEIAKEKILRDTDLTLLRLEPKKSIEISIPDYIHFVDEQSLAIVNRQLATMIRVGVGLDRALNTIAKHITNQFLHNALSTTAIDVSRGVTFHHALSKHPRIFNPLTIAMTKAGEGSGMLPEMLDMLADLQESEYRNKKRLQSALTYPIFVIIVSLAAVFAMTLFFVPNFMSIYEKMHIELPLITKILIGFTQIFTSPAKMLIVAVIVLIIIFVAINYIRTPQGRLARDKLRIKLPLIGNVILKTTMSRFCATLATLYSAGIPLAECLIIISEIFDDSLMREAIAYCTKGMKSGLEMSSRLREFSFIPSAVPDMIAVGEESGELKLLLEKLAEILEMDAVYSADSLWKLLEPATIVFLAFVVGFIMLAVFMPLYQMIMLL
ncbi:MAG: type II secretion system F family protein [Chloroflexi bacterium]|nr:type II secretion system F family protein [Chloroflexota bacterium]